MIYVTPETVWEKFQTNKAALADRYLTCADDDFMRIILTADESGNFQLICEDYQSGDVFDQTFFPDEKEDAVEAYEEMLSWLEAEDEDEPEEPESEIPEKVLAAAYAFIGVLTGEDPDDLGVVRDDLESLVLLLDRWLQTRGVESSL